MPPKHRKSVSREEQPSGIEFDPHKIQRVNDEIISTPELEDVQGVPGIKAIPSPMITRSKSSLKSNTGLLNQPPQEMAWDNSGLLSNTPRFHANDRTLQAEGRKSEHEYGFSGF